MLQAVTSSQHIFVCIDAPGECAVVYRAKLLGWLKQILQKFESTRIFIIGRPHIWAEVEKLISRPVISVLVSFDKDDITGYLRVRLDEDETPEAMDEGLGEDILLNIRGKMSEMYLWR